MRFYTKRQRRSLEAPRDSFRTPEPSLLPRGQRGTSTAPRCFYLLLGVGAMIKPPWGKRYNVNHHRLGMTCSRSLLDTETTRTGLLKGPP